MDRYTKGRFRWLIVGVIQGIIIAQGWWWQAGVVGAVLFLVAGISEGEGTHSHGPWCDGPGKCIYAP